MPTDQRLTARDVLHEIMRWASYLPRSSATRLTIENAASIALRSRENWLDAVFGGSPDAD